MSTLTTEPRTLDLDKALKETEPLAVTYNGKTYDLPSAIASRVILKHIGKLTPEGGIALDGLEEFIGDLIGHDVLEQMLDDGLPYTGLEELLRWLLAEYGIVTEVGEEGDSPNPQG